MKINLNNYNKIIIIGIIINILLINIYIILIYILQFRVIVIERYIDIYLSNKAFNKRMQGLVQNVC